MYANFMLIYTLINYLLLKSIFYLHRPLVKENYKKPVICLISSANLEQNLMSTN